VHIKKLKKKTRSLYIIGNINITLLIQLHVYVTFPAKRRLDEAINNFSMANEGINLILFIINYYNKIVTI